MTGLADNARDLAAKAAWRAYTAAVRDGADHATVMSLLRAALAHDLRQAETAR